MMIPKQELSEMLVVIISLHKHMIEDPKENNHNHKNYSLFYLGKLTEKIERLNSYFKDS